jgi:hypothetical protein
MAGLLMRTGISLPHPSQRVIVVLGQERSKGEGIMSTQNWIIAAVVVVLLIIAGYFWLRPAGEAPPTGTTPPATTEQPAQPPPAQ